MAKRFTTHLHVDKKIVPLLSRSTYKKSFAGAIRELVSNAYDADSLSVNITIDKGYKVIEIVDDGNGMTEKEFQKYLTIAGTKTASTTLTRKYKRKRIGQFGVGFLSIFPFCEELEITTTTENSDEVLIATIPAIKYWRIKDEGMVEDVQISGSIIDDSTQKAKHYTKIKLVNPTYLVRQYFSVAKTKKRDTILKMDPFEKFTWELCEDLPISFQSENKVNALLKYEEPVGINVFVNEMPLYRNDLLDIVLDSGSQTVAGVKCQYIFTTSYKSIKPLEARGVKRRVNNVGIGPRTDFELRRDRGFSRLHWIQGEIHYAEDIKEHLSISRDSFLSSPVIDELDEFFAGKLRELAYLVEDIAVAEKEIEQTIADTKKGRTTPKEIVIESNLEKLENRGFKVERVKGGKIEPSVKGKKNNLVKVDKEKKTVIVHESEELRKDFIEVMGRKYEVIYKNDGFSESDSPCRFSGKKSIEVSSKYPAFQSKSHGDIFRRFHIMMLIAQQESRSSKEMYKLITKQFIKEFKQFI